MAIKVPGSLGGLQIVEESTYGVTPTDVDFTYLGFMETMQATNNNNEAEQQADGSRTYDDVVFGAQSASLSADLSLFRNAEGYDWKKVVDLTLGTDDDVPSFTSLMKVASDQYVMMKGCKMDRLTLASAGVGQKVTAKTEIKAMQLLPEKSSKAGFGTLGDEDEGPAKNAIIYNAYPTTSLTGEASTIPSSKFSISIGNSLTEKEGIVGGVALAAGQGLVPDKTEIAIEYTIMSVSRVWDDLKVGKTKDFIVTQVIGGYRFVFRGCYLPGNDLPSRSQSTYDETITIKASSVTVTAV